MDIKTDKRLEGVLIIGEKFVPIMWNGEERLITVEEYLGIREGWLTLRDLLD